MKYCSSSLVCVTRPPPPTTTTAAARRSSSSRRRRRRRHHWQNWKCGIRKAGNLSQVWSSMAYDEALLFSYLWILPVTSFLLHCAEGSVNGFFSSKVHITMPLAGSHQQRHFLLLWFLLPTSLTIQDSTAYSMFELGGAFRDHSLWDRCLCIAVSLEFEHYVQFLCILVLRYEISLFDMGVMYPRSSFPFLYLWLSVHTGGKLSDWLQLNYSVVYYQLECISGIETNGLLEMTKVVISFVRNDDKYI